MNANVKTLVGTATIAVGKKTATTYINKKTYTAGPNNRTNSNKED
jgi:hypothetical protein